MLDDQSYRVSLLPWKGQGAQPTPRLQEQSPLLGAAGPRLADAEGDKPQPPSAGTQRATARFAAPQEKRFQSVQALSTTHLTDFPHPHTQ